jgi:hypothetical protein
MRTDSGLKPYQAKSHKFFGVMVAREGVEAPTTSLFRATYYQLISSFFNKLILQNGPSLLSVCGITIACAKRTVTNICPAAIR